MAVLLGVAHAGCMGCLVLAGLSAPAITATGVIASTSLYASLRRHAFLRSRHSPVRLMLGSDGHVALFSDGRVANVELLPGGVNTRFAVILALSIRGRRRLSVPVLPDMTDPDTYRRLRVWLTVNG